MDRLRGHDSARVDGVEVAGVCVSPTMNTESRPPMSAGNSNRHIMRVSRRIVAKRMPSPSQPSVNRLWPFDETITRLRAHKTARAELKMRNRMVYQDFDLVFARELEHLHLTWTQLGQPTKAMAEWSFAKLLKEADVRRITFHGVRHTVATLLLQAGVPVHLVSARLGHSQTSQTLNTYAHALPSAQADAVARLGSVLHG
jgi:integrase